MNAVRAQQPDFFVHLGDTIYADRGGKARQLNEFWAKYRGNRDDAAQQLCSLRPVFMSSGMTMKWKTIIFQETLWRP